MPEYLSEWARDKPRKLYDAHIHLDFIENGEEVAGAACEAGTQLLSATVTPDGYLQARERFAAYKNVTVGLGLHPWWVDEDPAAADQTVHHFLSLLDGVELVSEVGLDFGKRHLHTAHTQRNAFTRIAHACAQEGNKILSLHAVHAASEVLDVLEEAGTLKTCICVFHWYSGPSDQLKRAIQQGCFFSVGLRMLASKKGCEYARIIPAQRLLLETDAPAALGDICSFEELVAELQQIRGVLENL